MTHAALGGSQFQGAILQGVSLYNTTIEDAQFQGSVLESAHLHGAVLNHVSLEGADLRSALFYAATFKLTHVQGALLDNAGMQGVVFQGADIQGTSFKEARLQGTSFSERANVSLANFSNTFLWQSAVINCDGAQVIEPNLAPIVGKNPKFRPGNGVDRFLPATLEGVQIAVEQISSSFPAEERQAFSDKLRGVLNPHSGDVEMATAWRTCADHALPEQEYLKKLDDYLVTLACVPSASSKFIAERLVLRVADKDDRLRSLAAGIVSSDGNLCYGARGIEKTVRTLLLTYAAPDLSGTAR